jgi:hypothetical protein
VTVVLNEANLRLLLDTAQGPVGRDLQRRAIIVEQFATEEARRILHRGFANVDALVESEIQENPLQAVIGAVGPGKLGDYLQQKAIRERSHSWIERALFAGFNG